MSARVRVLVSVMISQSDILTGYAVEVLERDADGTTLQSLQALLGERASLGGDFGKHELWAR